jgi:hypothetical protein
MDSQKIKKLKGVGKSWLSRIISKRRTKKGLRKKTWNLQF